MFMSIRYVRLQGSHYKMGLQHGEQLAEVITDALIPFISSSTTKLGISPKNLKELVNKYKHPIEKRFPQILQETKGIAEGAGINFEQALLVLLFHQYSPPRVSNTLLNSEQHCSSFVATGGATTDGEPISSQNSDWPKERCIDRLRVAFKYQPDDGYAVIGRGIAGHLGGPAVIGFNEKGLSLVGSGVTARNRANFELHPWMICRLALEKCSSVSEFIDFMEKIPRWQGGENLCVSDIDGHVARIGFSVKRIMITRSRNFFLASTNHYHTPEMQALGPQRAEYPSSFRRYHRLVELLKANFGNIDVDTTMKIMSDHEFGDAPPESDKSICRHAEDLETFTNTILRPSEGKLWISRGTPCKKEYSSFTI